jgi:uncharacterized membrane protein YbhN (UPF0104 family)
VSLSSFEGVSDTIAAGLLGLPWVPLAAVAALGVLSSIHFLSAACAVRAVSGRRLALVPTAFAQVAAAATNRIVPNGIGGTGVNLRYLLRAGVPLGAAASGLAALLVIGGLTDAGYVAAVVALGPAIGLNGGARELSVLSTAGGHLGQSHVVTLAVVAALVAAVLIVRRRRPRLAQVAAASRQALGHARALICHPRPLGAAALASTATTVALSAGFVLAVDVWGRSASPLPAGALVAVYLVASAAGGATPLPSFFAVTEIALVAALVLGGYSSGSALVAVAVFRVVTYWLPLPVGVWMGQRLRKTRLL